MAIWELCLQSVGNYLPANMAKHPRKYGSSGTPLWESQISWSFHCFLKLWTTVIRFITRSIISFLKHIIRKHKWRILKLWSVISRCQRLIRRSSAERYVSWSELTLMELMWYVCALANILLGDASTISSIGLITGTWKTKRKSQTLPAKSTLLSKHHCCKVCTQKTLPVVDSLIPQFMYLHYPSEVHKLTSKIGGQPSRLHHSHPQTVHYI